MLYNIGGIFIKYLILATLCVCGLFLFVDSTYAEEDYVIKRGDGLKKIAERYNANLDTLIAANESISNPDSITAGNMIAIPDNKGTSFTVTAYTAGAESTGKQKGDPGYGITASGNEVQENQTLACPPSLSFGTEVHIPALDETYICEDRGSAITNGHLDVYIEDLDAALEFGVKELTVEILD